MQMKKVDVPEGVSGDWRVERFTVSDDEAKFHNVRCMLNHRREGNRQIRPGNYTKLMRGDVIVMSDTPAEMRDHWTAMRLAKGDILINGLGLGLYAENVLLKDDVSHVTIIEKSPDVIRLVADHLYGRYGRERLEIIEDDALGFRAPVNKVYDFVWHDIWDYISPENSQTMGRLHRKYGRKCMYQDSWCRTEVKKLAREDRENAKQIDALMRFVASSR